MDKFKFGVVVTGTIGSGKSSVCNILKQKGYDIIDADMIAHKVLDTKKEQLVSKFSNKILTDGDIDRKKLGDMVFKDRVKLNALEDILGNEIFLHIKNMAIVLENLRKIYFLDIPLYFEKIDKYKIFSNVLVVYSSLENQIFRIINRNNVSKTRAINQINLQLCQEFKIANAKFLIENNGSLDDLKLKVEQILLRINDEIK